MTEPILETREVTCGYADDMDILEDVSLTVRAGTISGLIGLNGAGKTTLMKALCGFISPRKGRVILDGADITGQPPHRLMDRGMWYIPQESSLFPFMSVRDNLELVARRHPDKSARHRVADVLHQFPIVKEKLDQPAGSLSGGPQNILEFAKLLIVRARVCLIDEPSVGLAPSVVEEVYGFIERFARDGMGILLVDHNVRAVIKMSSWVSVLSLGRITAEGPAEEFRSNLHEQVQEWLGIDL